ncbi:MAG: ABC transporter ATP-binding protein [Arcobacteraceae bacterium]|jgi:putative ABC transport system ATP-binding protein|nr:ABC transporter ATP-binding protein [Arcobacteraceae bacterium]
MDIPAIKVENLFKEFKTKENSLQVIKGISFELQKGEISMFVGPSGSGKTTLLTMLGCILEPTSGKMSLNGEVIYDDKWILKDTRKLRREKLGFIFQSHNLIPFLNVEENITLLPQLNGITKTQYIQKANELLKYLGIEDKNKYMIGSLSGGQSQRVAIARSLANNPRIILADEPTAALDKERAISVMELLRKIAKEQEVAIIVVTHDERLLPFFDSVLKIEDGYLTKTIVTHPL